MALLISKNIPILNGIATIPSVYVRFKYSVSAVGKNIYVESFCYSSKVHSVKESNRIEVPRIFKQIDIPYDRSIDGVDILSIIHNYYINDLTNPRIGHRTDLDEKTGKYIKSEVVIDEAFVNSDEIEIVDIDEI